MLGGIEEQIVAIKMAKQLGMYVITCDFRPDNPGHAYSDEYHNVSITDKEAVYELAQQLNVDAVVCYALEAGVQSAAYAQEKLGKPTSPYESVRILSNKNLFRHFLLENGFNAPRLFSCHNKETARRLMKEHLSENTISLPVVVKPADLWGSRGVSRVDSMDEYDEALELAFNTSMYGEIIVEEYIEGQALEGDAFAVDGELRQYLWSDVYPDTDAPNPITPTIFCTPAQITPQEEKAISDTLQRLMNLLNMKTNAYNIEIRLVRDKDVMKVYLMEVAPRNGGNSLPVYSRLATTTDMIKGTLLAALGESCQHITHISCKGFWANCVMHTNKEGLFNGIRMTEAFEANNFVAAYPGVKIGEHVHPYSGTNMSLGTLFARFKTRAELDAFRSSQQNYFTIDVVSE